jgi:hypothetical protein
MTSRGRPRGSIERSDLAAPEHATRGDDDEMCGSAGGGVVIAVRFCLFTFST